MAERTNHPGRIKLTMKKARELAIQELGTAKGLMAEPCSMKGYYCMTIGNLTARIHPDWCGDSGCIILTVALGSGSGESVQFHDPETLEQNFGAEEKRRMEIEQERLETWVDGYGPEHCHQKIDEIWNRQP